MVGGAYMYTHYYMNILKLRHSHETFSLPFTSQLPIYNNIRCELQLVCIVNSRNPKQIYVHNIIVAVYTVS